MEKESENKKFSTWNPSREMKEEETWKNQKTRNSKLDVKSL
jgi:hypothetical protein